MQNSYLWLNNVGHWNLVEKRSFHLSFQPEKSKPIESFKLGRIGLEDNMENQKKGRGTSEVEIGEVD